MDADLAAREQTLCGRVLGICFEQRVIQCVCGILLSSRRTLLNETRYTSSICGQANHFESRAVSDRHVLGKLCELLRVGLSGQRSCSDIHRQERWLHLKRTLVGWREWNGNKLLL